MAEREVTVSYAQLTAGGLFTTSAADYLRMYVGTGVPTGGNKTVYVDDIVGLPTNASFSYSTFDYRGLKTSSTGNNHRTIYFDLGLRGEVAAVRDENFRIHSQSGFHRMGEN